MPETFAHTITIRRDVRGRWVVTHSWRAPGSSGWRHASKHFGPCDQRKALVWADSLKAAYPAKGRESPS